MDPHDPPADPEKVLARHLRLANRIDEILLTLQGANIPMDALTQDALADITELLDAVRMSVDIEDD